MTRLAALVVAALAVACPSAGRTATPPLARLVGQEIVTGIAGRTPGPWLLARIRAGQVGGVLLFGRNIGSDADVARLVGELQAAAAAGGNPPLLVAVDQEGGAVERLPSGPPDLSPRDVGETGSSAKAASEGGATAAYLRRLGIDVDLAPVLDTPSSPSSFLGSRAYSSDPALNARLGSAFIGGLQRGGVAGTAKHFPGLGTARATTDTAALVLRSPARVLETGLLPFQRAIAGGVDLVMVSNAGYRAYDPTGTPASCSRAIVTGLLRRRLGFRGVVITDDLEAPGPQAQPDAPLEAARAGVDLLLYAHERTSAAGYNRLLAAARSGRLPPAELEASARRIAALKQKLS